MSRLARKPLQIPAGITAALTDSVLKITKDSRVKHYNIPQEIELAIDDTSIACTTTVKTKAAAALLGTTHANILNIMIGLEKGFTKELQLVGIGYGVVMDGNELVFTLGKSHQDRYTIKDGIKITLPDKTNIIIFGEDKHLVGDVADEIIRFRPPDAYKGKGIRDKRVMYKLKEVTK